jgi:ABC-type oligopeptide transport system substrate-binding subunit
MGRPIGIFEEILQGAARVDEAVVALDDLVVRFTLVAMPHFLTVSVAGR